MPTARNQEIEQRGQRFVASPLHVQYNTVVPLYPLYNTVVDAILLPCDTSQKVNTLTK